MKLIINTSNLHGGGGVQVGYSFIHECLKFVEHEYHIFLCPQISQQIDISSFPSNFYFYNFPTPPSPTLKGIGVISQLNKIEKKIKPDCVFSIFGPTYWTPKTVHLMGYAIPHFLYPESPFFKIINLKDKLKWKMMSNIKRFYFKANANYYHVETEDARLRLEKYLSCSKKNIYTVSNTFNSIYNTAIIERCRILPLKLTKNEYRLLCISAYYSHKNLEILNLVIPLLIEKGFKNLKFVLTIDQKIFDSIFSKTSRLQIINVGQIAINDCPQLYSECDVMFLPTLLECFSANYPEAMKMKKPILTSDLSFAHSVCGNAAIYFDPLNERNIVMSILKVYKSKKLQNELITNGIKRLIEFNSAEKRAEKYLNICKDIILKI